MMSIPSLWKAPAGAGIGINGALSVGFCQYLWQVSHCWMCVEICFLILGHQYCFSILAIVAPIPRCAFWSWFVVRIFGISSSLGTQVYWSPSTLQSLPLPSWNFLRFLWMNSLWAGWVPFLKLLWCRLQMRARRRSWFIWASGKQPSLVGAPSLLVEFGGFLTGYQH